MNTIGLVLVGLAIAVGLVGVVVPLLPGLLLCWAAVLVWAIAEHTAAAWIVLGFATVVTLVSQVVKYLVPGRQMRASGVPWSTLLAGAVGAIIGFFLIPVVGLLIGFPVGVFIAEFVRLGDPSAAWPSTVQALKALGLSILIELGAGLLVAAAWLGVVLFA